MNESLKINFSQNNANPVFSLGSLSLMHAVWSCLWFSRTTGYSVYGIISQHKLYYQGALTFEWKYTTQMILRVLLTPIDVFHKVQCRCQGKGGKCLLIIILRCSCLLLRADFFFQSSAHFTLYILMLY